VTDAIPHDARGVGERGGGGVLHELGKCLGQVPAITTYFPFKKMMDLLMWYETILYGLRFNRTCEMEVRKLIEFPFHF
jgi:hypothetical protein